MSLTVSIKFHEQLRPSLPAYLNAMGETHEECCTNWLEFLKSFKEIFEEHGGIPPTVSTDPFSTDTYWWPYSQDLFVKFFVEELPEKGKWWNIIRRIKGYAGPHVLKITITSLTGLPDIPRQGA